MEIHLDLLGFKDGAAIPAKYSCDGENISPPLAWCGLPAGCKSLALIHDDPDAPRGPWLHWLAFNLPGQGSGLPENASAKGLPQGSVQGKNDFGKLGYGGPCPPGGTHRYFYKLYALDTKLSLLEGAGKNQVLKAMQGHILAEAQCFGRYSHPKE